MKIVFVLPEKMNVPVGGYKIIYEYADFLAGQGYEVAIDHFWFWKHDPRFTSAKTKTRLFLKKIAYLCHLKRVDPKIPWYTFKHRVNLNFKLNFKPSQVTNGDCVIATAWFTAPYVNTLSKFKKAKFYFVQHYEIWDGAKSLVDATWKLPMHKIVIASWLKDIAAQMGEKAEFIPNFVDDDIRLTNPIEQRKPTISMLYHTNEWKGTQDGLKAITSIHRKDPKVKVKLFGVYPRPTTLPDWIQYYQNPAREVLRDEIYNQSSIFVFPSRTEGWGLTATEAMACGAALVATDNGGVRDFGIHNQTALISPVQDSKQLAANILRLLNDEQLRVELATNGIKFVAKYRISNSGSQLAKFLEEQSKNE
ncbi:glycosyltransferase family 4 protein [Pediococcus cellicola]|uniref:Cps1B protein n=1 Tax=Pediococcus cellicola TaxID=319652 RepID=A0A0R2IM23_9LACO|nr:glycosyltransferase family 4 protein [Pediococcus cellicola]KRN66080.1 cps1B protein [Pediococcus cellicola]GEL15448.1 glycosyltransferase family 1 (GT1) [Pediococcus cellicola]